MLGATYAVVAVDAAVAVDAVVAVVAVDAIDAVDRRGSFRNFMKRHPPHEFELR